MEIIGYVLGQQQGSYSTIEPVTVGKPDGLVIKKTQEIIIFTLHCFQTQ